MTIEQVLAAEGYTADESKQLIDNPKHKGLLEKILKQSEEGTTALLKAQELEKSIREFNDNTVIPYGAKKDAETAAARAEVARLTEHLKSLKEAGYEIPDSYFATPPAKPAEPTGPKFVETRDLDNQGRAYMALLSASERARDLLGHGLDIESEYDDFGKNKRPSENLRQYIDRKYDLTAKQQAREAEKAAKERKAIGDAAVEEYNRLHPRSANEELAVPRASKFDKFKQLPDERKNLWQTQTGREQATRDRREKYKSLLLQ